MGVTWATAFTTSTVVALVATPLLRRVALAAGLLDQPAARKPHHVPTPYLGGVAIMLATVAGSALGRDLPVQLGVVAFAAAVLGAVGLLDDRHALGLLPRLVTQVAAAAAVVGLGIRAEVTAIAAIDICLTIVWVVGITNALNLLDNMDGLSSGVTLVAAGAIFALAALGGQPVVATAAAGLAGACLGFLAHNSAPAAIFMGDAGSLFLGFLLSVTALEVDPDLAPPASWAVPLLVLALPVLDTTTVTLGRLRRRRPLTVGGQDHLSHRLVARGLPPGWAVGVLVAAQGALGSLGVLFGRGVLSGAWTAGLAALLVAGILAAALPAPVYRQAVVGFPRWLTGTAAAAALAGVILSGSAAVALVRARSSFETGVEAARRAVAAASSGAPGQGAVFAEAAASFERASDLVEGPLLSLVRGVPVVGSNLAAGRHLASAGRDLAAAGGRLATLADPGWLRIRGGAVPLEEVERIRAGLDEVAGALEEARARVSAIDRVYLVPPVERAIEELDSRLEEAGGRLETASRAARLARAILGGDGPRRYFLAAQNPAEARATGGFIGNWGELVAEGGRLRLERFDRVRVLNTRGDQRVLRAPEEFIARYERFEVDELWQNVNMTPDFPTAARVIADLYPQSGGRPVDGVIAVDPPGLAALLELTGPVQGPGWPEPLTPGNVVDVTLRDAYERLPSERRAAFLGDVAGAVWHAFATADLGDPLRIGRVLGEAARRRHLLVHLSRPEEQQLVERLGLAGAVPPVRSDSLLVVNQNAAGNKVDYYLGRRLRYSLRLEPIGDETVGVTGRLELELTNHAPASGPSPEAIGPYDGRFLPGENRTFVSLYSPLAFRKGTLDGEAMDLESGRELGRHVYSAFVSIPAGGRRTLVLELSGRLPLGPGRWYALDLVRQPLLAPDRVELSFELPEGWRVADAVGLRPDGRRARARVELDRDQTVWLRLERTGWRGLWDRLRGEPGGEGR